MEFAFLVTRIGLSGITAVSAFALTILAIVKVKENKDPLRTWVSWLRTAAAVSTLYYLLDVVSYGLYAFTIRSRYRTVTSTTNRVDIFDLFLQHLMLNAIAYCIAEGVSGIRVALHNHVSKHFRRAIFAIGGIITVFSLVAMLGLQVQSTRYLGASTFVFGILELISWCLHIISAIVILVVASKTRSAARKADPHALRTPCNYILATAILLLLVGIWSFPLVRGLTGIVLNILDPILYGWTCFVILTLVYVLARKKADGLWSTSKATYPNEGSANHITNF